MSCLKALLLERLLIHVVSNTNLPLCDEIHLQYFLFLIIDYVLIFFLAEVSWLKTKGYIIEELALLIFLWIKEEAEVVEHIIEQVMHDDSSLDRARQSVDEVIVFLYLGQTVVSPVVFEVLVNLSV